VGIYIDSPDWPARGQLWAHLISDTSFAELHAFARKTGIPAQAFDHDHYDIPQNQHAECLAAGAQLCRSREIVAMLRHSGLRKRKRSRLAPR
jgi:hypothetical protein